MFAICILIGTVLGNECIGVKNHIGTERIIDFLTVAARSSEITVDPCQHIIESLGEDHADTAVDIRHVLHQHRIIGNPVRSISAIAKQGSKDHRGQHGNNQNRKQDDGYDGNDPLL